MTTYLVHVPVSAEPGTPAGLDRSVFVKDRFHWLALLFPAIWLIVHRAWLGLLAYVIASVGLLVVESLAGLPDQTIVLSQFLLNLALAVFAPDVRSWTLARRGWRLVDVVAAADDEDAARRFYDRWLTNAASAPTPASTTASAGLRRGVGGASAQPVVGLFPEAGRS